jgi:D-alanine-D-alanine ligase
MTLDENVKRYKNKKIGVLMGGLSSEREISLRSGECVDRSLQELGLNTVKIDAGPDLVEDLKKSGIDIAFNLLHGRFGEDGAIQGLLEILGIPYTGSGILGSAIGIDKVITKNILAQNGIPVPPCIMIDTSEVLDSPDRIVNELGFPFILKPNSEGSSIGVKLIKDESQFKKEIKSHMDKYPSSFAEKYIQGKEITIGVAGGRDRIMTLPILGLKPSGDFYDFNSKYTKGLTRFELPADISKEKQIMIEKYARKAFRGMRLCGVARFDAILDKDENPYFLEVNTIPGMTETSDIPAMARAAGCYEDLLFLILDSSLK